MRRGAVAGVVAKVLGKDFLELQAEIGKSFPDDAVGRLRLLERVRPTVDERTGGLPSVGVGDGDLQEGSALPARNAGYADAVGANIGQLDRSEVGNAVGGDVIPGIAQFIEQLFFYSVGADAS